MAEQFLGVRTTFQTDQAPENRIVRRVDDELSLLEPNEGPLITLLLQLKKRSSTDTPRLEWYEDDYVARWVNISAAGAASGVTTFVLAAPGMVVAGDMLVVPGVVTSNALPEIIRVTAVNTDGITLTVQRGFAGTTTGAIAASAPLRIIGPSYQENDPFPNSKVRRPTAILSYTQIFRTSCQFSKTQVATKTYNAPGGERQREHKKKLKEHKIAMNASFLFGKASETMDYAGTGRPLRTTMGVNSVVSTNGTAVDAGGSLTYKTFEEFSRRAFRYGKNTKLLIGAPIVKSAISFWGFSKLMLSPGETRLGVNIQKVTTAHGTWLLANDWMLENSAQGSSTGFGGMAFSLDLDQLEMRYLNANGENRNTHIIENAVRDGRDGYMDEILTEAGLIVKQPLYHTKIYNVTDFTTT